MPPLAECEHPAAPPEFGEYLVQHVLDTLGVQPGRWAKTVFFVMYDENGGFFDHVPPPTPPAGTAGEYLTVTPLPSSVGGIAGPVGLGFRVPCLVISPFSAGGFRLLGRLRPHVAAALRSRPASASRCRTYRPGGAGVTGDLTGALNLTAPPVTKVPSLPSTSIGSNSPWSRRRCSTP